MDKIILIPPGYEAKIEGDKVVFVPKESEDEKIRRAIFKALSKKEIRNVILMENIKVSDALDWLEKQKEQKPAEWSKEDEEMRSKILQDLANIKAAFPKVNIQEEFDWLNSLPKRFK